MQELLDDFSWGVAFLIFTLFVVMDILYAYYTLSVTRIQPLRASTAAAVMYFVNAVGVMNYVDNPLYLFPIATGSFVGTYAIMKREQRKTNQAGPGAVSKTDGT
jgi:hypothetical protein